MAENMTASLVSSGSAPELIRSPRTWELVKLVGDSTSAADTSQVYTCQYVKVPTVIIGGAVLGTVSGNTIVFKSLVALGSDTMFVWVGDAYLG